MLQYLKGENFRNFITFEVKTRPRFNFLYGLNGSGKTSILEAVYFLSSGKSFRSHIPQQVIHRQAEKFTLFAELFNHGDNLFTVGMERGRQGVNKNKMNGELLQGAAELAKNVPVILINQDGYSLIDGSPKEKRQFLDWGMFHVEPAFLALWRQLQQVVTQRNALLRKMPTVKMLQPWDELLFQTSIEIDRLRKNYFFDFLPVFREILVKFLPAYAIDLQYYAGWEAEVDLINLLESNRARDISIGYTQFGAHRADLRLNIYGRSADESLSRGEQKLLMYALKLAQGIHLHQTLKKKTIYLIDDLLAELDIHHQSLVLQYLSDVEAQVFVTATHLEHLDKIIREVSPALFHVEQGRVQDCVNFG